ncbi:MAG: YedE family putative selenium transporter [Sphaerochaetaceae bacterium]
MTIAKEKKNLLGAGALIGIIACLLVIWGNPKNMGFCIACFIRDIAGALKLHQSGAVQYLRPEILGLVLGSFIISLFKGEFSPRGGSSPLLRFCIGFLVMVGALVFLGCPLRMVLRLSGGDLNAIVGLLGFVAGVFGGCLLLNRGFSLGRSYRQSKIEALGMPTIQIVLLVMLLAFPALLAFSKAGAGPGALHAPLILSLLAGLVVGALAQRTRLCMAGGIRDMFLFKDSTLIMGPLAIFFFALIGNLITGDFHFGFTGQSVAHTAHLWNFLGMTLVGLGSVMLGGCPLRQLILAGEGNTDSAMATLGMLLGGALAHNLGLASSGKGPTTNGKVAVILGFVFLLGIAWIQIAKQKREDKQ